MKRFKRTLRYCGLAIMIVLAGFGIGLLGAASLFKPFQRDERHKSNTEQIVLIKEDDFNDIKEDIIL